MKIKTKVISEAEIEITEKQQEQITLSVLSRFTDISDIADLSNREGYYVDDSNELVRWNDWGNNRGGIISEKVKKASALDKALVVVINHIRK